MMKINVMTRSSDYDPLKDDKCQVKFDKNGALIIDMPGYIIEPVYGIFEDLYPEIKACSPVIQKYCAERGLDIKDFNIPVIFDFDALGPDGGNCVFADCNSFNQSVDASGFRSCAYMFHNCKKFDSPVKMPAEAICQGMFSGCRVFNQFVEMPNTRDSSHMFAGCWKFNQPVSISPAAEYLSGMFAGCAAFNQPVAIPDTADVLTALFHNCESFNQPVVIPDTAEKLSVMFSGCKSFNQYVKIPRNAKDLSFMFNNCESFDQPVEIPKTARRVIGMFQGCDAFNHPVNLPSAASDFSMVLSCCGSFNQPVFISSDDESCDEIDCLDMFRSSPKFNSPVYIDCNKPVNANGMFAGCESMNMPVHVSSRTVFCDGQEMFCNCYEFNQDVSDIVDKLAEYDLGHHVKHNIIEDMFQNSKIFIDEDAFKIRQTPPGGDPVDKIKEIANNERRMNIEKSLERSLGATNENWETRMREDDFDVSRYESDFDDEQQCEIAD